MDDVKWKMGVMVREYLSKKLTKIGVINSRAYVSFIFNEIYFNKLILT